MNIYEKTVVVGKSRWGSVPEPRLDVNISGAHYRQVNAYIMRLAAQIEELTPKNCGWVVQITQGGGIYLELMTGDDAEVAEAVRILKLV